MRNLSITILAILLVSLVCRSGNAQQGQFDYASSSLIGSTQCDPVSCEEGSGGIPVLSGYYIVNFFGTCYPAHSAPSFPLSMRASASVNNCTPPGVLALAEVNYGTTNFNENVCPAAYYSVDYETSIAEVFYASGVVAYQLSLTRGCDGTQSGPSSTGVAPC
jgi:hypothetical protein